MPTCPDCQDLKKCRACTGAAMVGCACANGRCQTCGGRETLNTGNGVIRCYDCQGTGVCPRCQGTRRVPCAMCHGEGYCLTCIDYRRVWKQASDLAKAGDAYNAAVVLQDLLKQFDEQKRTGATNKRLGGAGIGAVAGSFLLPGLGSILGAAIGNWLANDLAASEAQSRQTFEAETHYRLGVIYEMLHHPATLTHYMQAKLLDASHEKAAAALQRLQPTMPTSPHLEALDDNL